MSSEIWVNPYMKCGTLATHYNPLCNAAFKQPSIKPWSLVVSAGTASLSDYRTSGFSGNTFWGTATISVTGGGAAIDDIFLYQYSDFFGNRIRLKANQTYIWLCYLRSSSATKQVQLQVYAPEFGYKTSSLFSSWTVNQWALKYCVFTPQTATRGAYFLLCLGKNKGDVGTAFHTLQDSGNNITKDTIDERFKSLVRASDFNVTARQYPTWFYVTVASGMWYDESSRTIMSTGTQHVFTTLDNFTSWPRKGWAYHMVYLNQETGAAGFVEGETSQYPDEPDLPDVPAASEGGAVVPLARLRMSSNQFAQSGEDLTDLRCLDKVGQPIFSSASYQNFTSTGSFTVPQDGWYLVRLVGGGGGGAGGTSIGTATGGGGGGGSPLYSYLVQLSENDIYDVTLGAGGSKGSANSDGSDGGTTSFLRHSGSGSSRVTLYAWGGRGGISYGAYGGTGDVLNNLVSSPMTTLVMYSAGINGNAGDVGLKGKGGNAGAGFGTGGSASAGSEYGGGGSGGAPGDGGYNGATGWAGVCWIR